jgi:hypothetical protein
VEDDLVAGNEVHRISAPTLTRDFTEEEDEPGESQITDVSVVLALLWLLSAESVERESAVSGAKGCTASMLGCEMTACPCRGRTGKPCNTFRYRTSRLAQSLSGRKRF